jgi:hypothetical protein
MEVVRGRTTYEEAAPWDATPAIAEVVRENSSGLAPKILKMSKMRKY